MNEFEKTLQDRFLLQKEYLGDEKPINKIIPLVSVTVATYQHVNYIKDCLNGILMQKTDFPYEIVLGEDGSSDGTQEICKEYAEKYPDKIRLFIRDRNLSQFVNEDGSTSRFNGLWNRMSARGKYIAWCEGDDYWTDQFKLQRQVDLLEGHIEYSMCFHNAIEHWDDRQKEDRCFSNIVDREYSGQEIYKNWIVPTASVVFRKSILESEHSDCFQNPHFIYGDIVLFLLAASCGKVVGMKEVMSVYRRHEGGAVFDYNVKRIIRSLEHHKQIPIVFGKQYEAVSKELRILLLMSLSFNYLKQSDYFLMMKYLMLSLGISIKRTLFCIGEKMVKKI